MNGAALQVLEYPIFSDGDFVVPYHPQFLDLIYLTSIKNRDKANQSEPLFDIEVLEEGSAYDSPSLN